MKTVHVEYTPPPYANFPIAVGQPTTLCGALRGDPPPLGSVTLMDALTSPEQITCEHCLERLRARILAGADYTSLELRAAAELGLRPDQKDIHQATADLLGCSREKAKTWNWGVLYGGLKEAKDG